MISPSERQDNQNSTSNPGTLARSNGLAEFLIEEVSNPGDVARCRAQHDRALRNIEWLESHWSELLPQARGRFIAVAGQEAHLCDTAEAAWKWAQDSHPGDDGAFVQYIRPQQGPRVYESVRSLVPR